MNAEKAKLVGTVRQLGDDRAVLRCKNQWHTLKVTALKIRVGLTLKEVNQAVATAKGKVADVIGIMSHGLGAVSDPFEKHLSYLSDDSSNNDQDGTD